MPAWQSANTPRLMHAPAWAAGGAQGFAMAETDTAFNVSSRGQYLVTPGWTAKAQAQVRSAAPA